MKPNLISALLLALSACSVARADLVLLDTGDRYSGTVESLSAGVLKLNTEFGALSLPWEKISGLQTDMPLQFSLRGGGRIIGAVETRESRLTFPRDAALAGLTVPLDEVVGIGPVDAPPSAQLEGRLSAGANVSHGNTETKSYHVDGELIARTPANRLTISALANYGTDGDEQNMGDFSAFARYDHFHNDRWYVNSNAGVTHDEFRDLNLRTTLGIGLGYQFEDSQRGRLSAELGFGYIHEDFDTAPDENQPMARWALDYLYRFSDPGPTFFHHQEVFFGLDDTEDVILRSQTGLRVPLMAHISGGVEVNFDYDWQPPAEAKSTDVTYLFTLIYEI